MARWHWKTAVGAGVTALAALALSTGACQAADPAGCVLAKVGELPVKFVDNELLVQVSINGQPGWFVIDTGAVNTSMWGGAARAFGLRESTIEGVTFYGVGGGQDGMSTIVKSFGLAGQTVKDVKLVVIGHTGSPDDAGTLGRDFLGQFDLEFDVAARTVRLFQPQHCGDQSLAYWSAAPQSVEIKHDGVTDDYRLTIMVNGRPIKAILDSGASTTVVTPEAASTAGLHRKDYAAIEGYSHGIGEKAVATHVATFDTVGIGEEVIKHARLQIADLFADDVETPTESVIPERVDFGQPAMLLGADFLRSHRVFLSASQKRLYFTYSGGPVFEVDDHVARPPGVSSAPPPAKP